MKRTSALAVMAFLAASGLATSASAAVTVSSTTLDFGTLQVGDSLTLSLLLTNDDTNQVSVPISLTPASGPFFVGTSEFVLPPMFSSPLDVTFSPLNVGSFNGVLTIFTGQGDNPYLDVALIGSAAMVPEPESYAMFLAGLGVLGALARRKQKANA